MCGRYSLVCIDNLCGRFRGIDPMIGFRSHFNIAPGSTNPVIVVHERAKAVMMQWGLVPTGQKTSRPPIARSILLLMFSSNLPSDSVKLPKSPLGLIFQLL